ncbi:recombination protein NinG [Yersinia enterocolitica]|uniref:recombination protein NinG n=1 Tax=Yersinia enterocolitica TaxID=630 RepID=UPI0030356EB2
MNKLPSHRNCKVCKTRFKPETVYQWWCDEEHEKEYITKLALKARRDRIQKDEQRRKKETQAERQSLKVRKLELKPDSHFKKLAQQAFNEYIRTRDYDQPCISCGETNPPDLHGGQWDCGHFKTVGGFPELRFVECNAYRQCKSCNAGSAKYGGKAATVEKMYRESLAEKFGQELVDWLDGPHEMNYYRRDDYIRIRDEYRAKTKALKKLQEAA